MGKVLISGGSGLLGSKITELLLDKGIEVAHLSTRKNYKRKGVEVFHWNPKLQLIDEAAFDKVDTLIHLAGAGIADKRWTNARKKEIIDSRVESSQLLMQYLNAANHQIKQFIGASAIGYYGKQNGVLDETKEPGNDFLSRVCKVWEDSYERTPASINKVVFRIGIVLAEEGGALPEMTKTLPFFVGVLGNGKQVYSWIHIDDLANMFVHAIENPKISGIFNAVAPQPVTQLKLAKTIAKIKGVLTLPAPKFGLELMLGEMSAVLFLSQHCSAEKIESTGFKFTFNKVDQAIADLM